MKIILAALILMLTIMPANAQHKLDKKVMRSDDALYDSERLYKDLQNIVSALDETNQRHFLAIYSTYSTIGAVKTVENSIKKTVIACGEENPDLKEKMDDRFKTWSTAVKPVLKDANNLVDNMIIAQDYEKSKNIRKFLKRSDEVRQKTEESLNKIPVTTEKACNKLHDTMDETQGSLISLLEETLIAIPRAISQGKPENSDSEE